jgi:glutathione S-transferase
VRWALEEAGLSYETHAIEIADLKSPTYVQKHPFGMVPVLESENRTLFESGAIVFRIAEGCDALMPSTRAERTDTLAWMFAALSTVEAPLFNLFAIDRLHSEEQWAKLGRPAAVEAAQARLSALAGWLDGRDYLLHRFTAADVLMATVLRFIRHTDLIAALPMVDAYLKRCEARPAFQKALHGQLAGYARHAPVAA